MGYKDDKIKVLQMICAKTLPLSTLEEGKEIQEVSLSETEFEREGLSYNTAIMVFKEIFDANFMHSFKATTSKNNEREVLLSVSDPDYYTKLLKYPDYAQEVFEEEYADEILQSAVSAPSKTVIVIDDNKGIYRADNPALVYKIKSTSKRLALILFIAKKNKVFLSEIAKEFKQTETLAMKEIKAINATFQTKLKVLNNLIIHIDTGGYSLNRDKFEIQP